MKKIKESDLEAELRKFAGTNIKHIVPTPEEIEAILCRKKIGVTLPVFILWFEKKFGRKVTVNYLRWQEYKYSQGNQ